MYSDEIKRMIEERQGSITSEEYIKAFNPFISTQINHIKYDDGTKLFEVTTDDNYVFRFEVIYRPEIKIKSKKM